MSEVSVFAAELSEISRLEIIGPAGREWVKVNISRVSFSLQDDRRTLKIFYEETERSIDASAPIQG
jgi:hypothetical protein